MTRKPLDRRTLLRGFGAAVALPWLEAMSRPTSLITSAAHAATTRVPVGPTGPPVRMAFLYVPNGMHMPDWKPRGPSETEFELPKILQPLAAHRKQMNIITGLALSGAEAHGDGGGDHARSVAAFLTGAHPRKTHGSEIRNGISVDQVAAERIGHLTRLKSLELGTEDSASGGDCDTGYSCVYTSNISWRTATSPLGKEVDPAAVFERLFGPAGGAKGKQAMAAGEKRRKSVLDFVLSDAKRLKNDLGSNDRRKFDEYLYAVRDIERRMNSVDKLGKREAGIPDYPRPIGVPENYSEHVRLLLDMMVLAFQTDSTRVSSFMFANAGSNRSYRNLSISGGHHNISHHGNAYDKQQKISRINQYHASLAAHLIDRLANIREGQGSLLDNCMIVYGSGISDGNKHSHDDLPIALFGGGGGSIDSGRHIRVRAGTPLTNLYRSMLERVGAPVETFSDSSGVVEELKA